MSKAVTQVKQKAKARVDWRRLYYKSERANERMVALVSSAIWVMTRLTASLNRVKAEMNVLMSTKKVPE